MTAYADNPRPSFAFAPADALRRFSAEVGVKAALLQRWRGRWRFIGEGPARSRILDESNRGSADAAAGGQSWTGITLDESPHEWMVLVPGAKADWQNRSGIGKALEKLADELVTMSERHKSALINRANHAAYKLGRRLTRRTDADAMFRDIVDAMAGCVGADVAALAVFIAAEQALQIKATFGYPRSIVEHVRHLPGEGVIGRVFATGRPLLVGERGESKVGLAFPRRRRYRTESCIVMPLVSSGAVVGVVSVADPRSGDNFTRLDLQVLKRLAPAAALALDRVRLRGDLVDLAKAASIDPVTRLANRQYLHSRLEAEMQRAQRIHQPLAIMLVDIDDFKRVNDTRGHLEGDRLLRDVASVLRDSVRIFDVCTRYGGEEFAILMPGADPTVATQVADRVRRAVEQVFRETANGLRITVSAGIAMLKMYDSPDDLLGRADSGLLEAKAAGKNAVKFAC